MLERSIRRPSLMRSDANSYSNRVLAEELGEDLEVEEEKEDLGFY